MNNYAWQHRNRNNTAYINGRRGSMSQSDRQGIAAMIETSKRNNLRVNVNKPRIVNENENEVLILKDRNGKPVRFELNNNNTKPRGYSRPELNNNNNNNNNNVIRTKPVIRNNNTRPSYNNTRPSNNVRPRINNNNNTRSTSTNVNRSTNSRGGSGVRKN